LRVAISEQGLRELRFAHEERKLKNVDSEWLPVSTLDHPVVAQLQEYFAGTRRSFDLVLDLQGTEFQREVWSCLGRIPYGETRSYGEIASALGSPGAARAVGAANGKNPVAIVVPCHRVIGSTGKLTGFAGGIAIKEKLLRAEKNIAGRQLSMNW